MSYQNDLRQNITDSIIASLSKGVLPWKKPWSCRGNSGAPTNIVSKKPYKGINPILLTIHQQYRFDFLSKWYGTFEQWRKLGAKVKPRPTDLRKGELWGCPIIYYNMLTKFEEDPITGIEIERKFPVLKSFVVFNIDQVEGDHLDHLRADKEIIVEHDFIDFEPAERFIEKLNFDIRYGGDRAFYRVGGHIQVPHKTAFESPKEFYSTLFHECIHNTCFTLGIKEDYATEELIAEMGSCYLSSILNIPSSEDRSNSESYISHWLGHLGKNNKYIFWASAKASRCVDYLLKESGFQACQESEELVEATA